MVETLKTKERTWLNFGKTEDKIMRFIETSEKITKEDRAKIEQELQGKDVKELFRFMAISISWSSIALAIDAMINSIAGTTAFAKGAISINYLLPTILFSSVDFTIKYFFYRYHYKHLLTRWQTTKSALPTFGPFFLINELFKDSPTFAKALRLYIAEASPIKQFAKKISNSVNNVLGRTPKNSAPAAIA